MNEKFVSRLQSTDHKQITITGDKNATGVTLLVGAYTGRVKDAPPVSIVLDERDLAALIEELREQQKRLTRPPGPPQSWWVEYIATTPPDFGPETRFPEFTDAQKAFKAATAKKWKAKRIDTAATFHPSRQSSNITIDQWLKNRKEAK